MISHQILGIGLVSMPLVKVVLTALGVGIIGMTTSVPNDPDEAEEEDPDDEDSAEAEAEEEAEAEAEAEAATDVAEPEAPETETPAGVAAAPIAAAAAPVAAAPVAGTPPLPAAAATTPGTPAAGAVLPVIPDLAHPAAGVAAAPIAAAAAPVAAAPAAAGAGAVAPAGGDAPAGGEAPPAADPPPAAPADAAAPAPGEGEAPPAEGRTPTWQKILIAVGVLVIAAAIAAIYLKFIKSNSSMDTVAAGSASASASADGEGPVIPSSKDGPARTSAKSLCPAGYTAYAANDDNTCALLGYPANEVRDEVVTSPSPSHLVVCRNPPQWDKTNKMTDISGSDCEICLPSAVKPGEKIPMDIVARQVWGQRPSKIRQADWATLPCGQPRYPKCGVDLVDCTPAANPDGTMDGTGCFVLIKYVSPKSK